jgi:hypothetical protein
VSDGGLNRLLRERFRSWHWVRVESWSTGAGIPDVEYCAPGGVTGWLETKATSTLRVVFRLGQPAWLDRRARLGGRASILVRRIPAARKLTVADELWLVDGGDALRLRTEGLSTALGLCVGARGPQSWDWGIVERFLLRDPGEFRVAGNETKMGE